MQHQDEARKARKVICDNTETRKNFLFLCQKFHRLGTRQSHLPGNITLDDMFLSLQKDIGFLRADYNDQRYNQDLMKNNIDNMQLKYDDQDKQIKATQKNLNNSLYTAIALGIVAAGNLCFSLWNRYRTQKLAERITALETNLPMV